MTREEQILNGFTEMMKGFWGNQDLKVPDFEEPCKQEPCEDKRLYIQAWDKVKEDIKGIATFDNLDTVVEVMRIIDKHLQEIESEEKN